MWLCGCGRVWVSAFSAQSAIEWEQNNSILRCKLMLLFFSSVFSLSLSRCGEDGSHFIAMRMDEANKHQQQLAPRTKWEHRVKSVKCNYTCVTCIFFFISLPPSKRGGRETAAINRMPNHSNTKEWIQRNNKQTATWTAAERRKKLCMRAAIARSSIIITIVFHGMQ